MTPEWQYKSNYPHLKGWEEVMAMVYPQNGDLDNDRYISEKPVHQVMHERVGALESARDNHGTTLITMQERYQSLEDRIARIEMELGL